MGKKAGIEQWRGRGARSPWPRGAVLACVAAAIAAACGGDDSERLEFAKRGQGCSLDSDCYGDFVCVFERCHVECKDDGDCEAGQRCVNGQNGVEVCQLPDDRDCSANEDCREGQRCAEDLQCRDRCDTDEDCVTGQTCTLTGSCVSPTVDELDVNGELIPASSGGSAGKGGGGGTAGRGGSSGNGGGGAGNAGGATAGEAGRSVSDSGSGGQSGEGAGTGGSGAESSGEGGGGATGDAGAGASNATGGVPGSSTGGAGGHAEAGSPSGPGGAAGAAGSGEPGPVTETEPNETRDQPTVIALNEPVLGAISSTTDVDYYEFSAPSGVAGGYFQIAIEDVAPIVLTVRAYATANYGELYADETGNAGASQYSYFPAAPGASFQIAVTRWAGSVSNDPPYAYTLRATFTPIEDSFEPNDTRLTASEFTLGTTQEAYCFAGYVSSSLSAAAFADWYELALVAGTVSVTVPDVPTDLRLEARLHDSFGAPIGVSVSSATAGAGFTFSRAIPSDGMYYLSVLPSGLPWVDGIASLPTEIPNHFERPYLLSVEQP